ncbi:glycosyltransferase family 4 protein [Acinetobacter sp. ANC 5584]
MKQHKILIIGTIASSLYTFRKDLILALVEKGHQIYALTTDSDPIELAKISDLGVIVSHYEFSRGGLNPLADLANTYALYKKIKEIQPDIVFSYFAKPVIFGTIAAKLAKVPKIYAMIEGLGYSFTEQPKGISTKAKIIQNIQVMLFKVALPLADKVIFLNPDDPKDLLNQFNIKVKQKDILGGIGIHLNDYPYCPRQLSNITTFLFIGRLLKEKGINEFVGAAKIVKQKFPATHFVVLGSLDKDNPGSLSEDLLNQLVSTQIIEYPGQVTHIVDWIANSDVFVLPSYREGVPRSTQEAMAVGRAIITTDVPGCRETVIDGQNGFLVPKWNPQVLSEKMIFFIEHPEHIKKMGDESYRIAQEKFDSNKVNAKLLKILEVD